MSSTSLLKKNQQFTVIVPAAGVGKRMLASCPKQYLKINEQSILSHTVNRLISHKNINKVVLALSEADEYFSQTALVDNSNIIRVLGGKERVDSVLSGLQVINDIEWVLVHDAARPCITHEDIDKLIEHCIDNNCGGLLGALAIDTMKLSSKNKATEVMEVSETIDRSHLWHAFTPQMFKVKELKNAIEQAQKAGLTLTDESSAIESVGLPCSLVSGRRDNIKITRPEDLALADFYLKQQQIEQSEG